MNSRTIMLAVLILLAFHAAPAFLAQADAPTVAILRFGPLSTSESTEQAIRDMLYGYGFVNEEEYSQLSARRDMEGEHLNIIWGDANWSYADVNLIIEQALDAEADVIVTLSTPVTQAAVNTVSDMDAPPIILFANVFNSRAAGIAESTCVKPDYVTGAESGTPYEDIVPLLLLQNPDMRAVGTIYSSSEISGAIGAERIAEVGAALGLTVEQASVNSVSDVPLAADGLLSKGVEAFVIPADLLTTVAMPALASIGAESGIPVFHATFGAIHQGATVAAGTNQYYVDGRHIGRILVAWLNGEADIANTSVTIRDDLRIAINLDVAAMQGVEPSAALMDEVEYVFEGDREPLNLMIENLQAMGMDEAQMDDLEAMQPAGEFAEDDALEIPADFLARLVQTMGSAMSQQMDSGILAALQCTPEMIAEQQAQLAAAG